MVLQGVLAGWEICVSYVTGKKMFPGGLYKKKCIL